MSDQEFGTCDICKERGNLQRKYFRYILKCECHSPNHFELVRFCSNCKDKVVEPEFTKVYLIPVCEQLEGGNGTISVLLPTKALVKEQENKIDFSTGSKYDDNGFKFPDTVSVKDPLVKGDLTRDYSQYLAEIIVSSIKEQLLITDGLIHGDVSLEHLGCDSLDFLELFMLIENKLNESFYFDVNDELVEMFRKDVPIEEFISDFTKYFHKHIPKRKK